MDKDVPEHITTRIISQRKLTVDGVPFQWWAVGERPALVTVRAPLFGALSDFTNGDVAVFATTLAKRVLANHTPRAEKTRKVDSTPVLKRPGWFEPGNTDYSSTVF
jgi:hypothetical protein